MSIKFSKVIINGADVSNKVVSISESNYGYRVCFKDGASTFNKSDVNIFEHDLSVHKPFEITKHEWSDCRNLKCIGKDKGLETVCFKVSVFNGLAFFDLDKDDAIAIANHFDLTAEDLK